MGVNILLYRIKGVEEFKDQYPERLYKTFITEEIEWWDHLRYAGDKQFCAEIDFETRYEGDDPENYDYTYDRPLDFPKAIEWVKANISEMNQPRLLKVLEEMEKDKELWFRFSW